MDRVDRIVRALARLLALAGGAVLVALVAVTCVSVLGRALDGAGHSPFVAEWLPALASMLQAAAPVLGDFELVEMGTAFAVMAFWPWCQLERGHATVDIVSRALPARADGALAIVWEIVFALVVTLVAWRLLEGAQDKARYNETTFLLGWPVWWGYAAAFAASCVATLAAWWAVVLRVRDPREDRLR